jgi:hypothetical protein
MLGGRAMSRPYQGKADAKIVPTYLNAYNEIVRPKDYVSLSVYFIKHWLPKISENGLKVLIVLRTQGFYNPTTGEKREEIEIEQKHIAEQCGFSKRTLQRTFVEDAVLAKYVQREFIEKRDRTGRIIKEYYVYRVVMDDVMVPEDKALFNVMTEGRDKPICQNGTSVGGPRRQNDISERQVVTPMCQNDAPERQNVTPYKVNPITPITENTLTTPAAPGDSLSLFEEGIQDKIGREWTDADGAGDQTPPTAEEITAARAALEIVQPPLRPPKVAEIQSEWDAMTEEARDAFRPEAVRQLRQGGQESPPEAMVLPRMFRLFWAQRKGLASGIGTSPKLVVVRLDEGTDGK